MPSIERVVVYMDGHRIRVDRPSMGVNPLPDHRIGDMTLTGTVVFQDLLPLVDDPIAAGLKPIAIIPPPK